MYLSHLAQGKSNNIPAAQYPMLNIADVLHMTLEHRKRKENIRNKEKTIKATRKNGRVNKGVYLYNYIFFNDRIRSFISCTAIALKFKMHWFQTKQATELKSCKHI